MGYVGISMDRRVVVASLALSCLVTLCVMCVYASCGCMDDAGSKACCLLGL